MDQFKFVVLDEEDLEVVSTHLQDAVAKVSDVLWRPEEKRLVLRFERVLSCKCRDVNPAGKDGVLNLLAVEFTETDAPSGVVTITFSGGAALRLEVECLEAELADLGPSWTTAACPVHAVIEDASPKPDRR
jgi:hypothetical protein